MGFRFLFMVLLGFLYLTAGAVSGPVTPLRVCLNNNDSIATLEWTNPSNACGTFTQHRIYGRKNANPFMPMAVVGSFAISSFPLKLPDLDAGWEFYWVTLYACNGTDSFTSAVIKVDDQKPILTSLDSVSIDLSTQQLVAGWQKGLSPDTKGYRIYRYNSGINDSITETDQTGYLLNQILNPNIEVTLSTFDSCNLFSAISNPHRAIQLTGSLDTCKNAVSLNWRLYQGWTTQSHSLYIRQNTEPYRLLSTPAAAEVSALFTQFVLGDSFCFFVRAHNGLVSSSSNQICFKTRKKTTPDINYIRHVTVLDDNAIEIDWSGNKLEDVAKMVLEKKSTGGFVPYQTKSPVISFTQTDNAVNAATSVYQYRVILNDVCDVGLDTSNISHNILLTLNNELLNWNAYDGWDGAVDGYELFYGLGSTWNNEFYGAPQMRPLSEKELAEPKICFYVRAKELGNTLFADDQSISNVVCQEGPFTYYVPNTIVSDGINNRFIVKGVNIDTTLSKYTIFNRWGEILHKSESIFEPWYPVYRGVDLMPGMYFYILELFSNKGERKTVKGEIRIIK